MSRWGEVDGVHFNLGANLADELIVHSSTGGEAVTPPWWSEQVVTF